MLQCGASFVFFHFFDKALFCWFLFSS